VKELLSTEDTDKLTEYCWIYEEGTGGFKTVFINHATWFVACEINKDILRVDKHSHLGFVYAIEYGTGIKIGSTKCLASRIKSIMSNAKNYSDIATGLYCFTEPHIEFRATERLLHKAFADKRIGASERFDVTLDDFLQRQPPFAMTQDETQAKIKEKEDADRLFAVLGIKR